ncbi:hypothetical protein, partial [Staphylococcus aureus]|uniref:hypothetical protein n=1 Tax=Staphylococcus aureus TaxID=1280 RepID=UPI001A9C8A20
RSFHYYLNGKTSIFHIGATFGSAPLMQLLRKQANCIPLLPLSFSDLGSLMQLCSSIQLRPS